MYSKNTIKKVVSNLSMAVNNYASALKRGDAVKACISDGNRKIGRVLNVSLAPVICCGNCKECKSLCYDIKACLQYKNVIDARARNTALAKFARDEYFAAINSKMDRRRANKYFRYHVSGDILDYDYFSRMVESAKNHPDFIVWTYTKMYHIVNEWIRDNGPLPENLVIMFSEWDGTPMENPYNMPVFSCKLKDGNKNRTAAEFATMYKCPGNCDVCKDKRRGCIGGKNTYCDEH